MGLTSFCSELLATKESTTPEEFRGVLAHVFDALPPDAAAANYAETLVSAGFNNLTALALIDRDALKEEGIKTAHQLLLLAAITGTLPVGHAIPPPPPALPDPLFDTGNVGGASGLEISPSGPNGATPIRLTAANDFPDIRASGLPARG